MMACDALAALMALLWLKSVAACTIAQAELMLAKGGVAGGSSG